LCTRAKAAQISIQHSRRLERKGIIDAVLAAYTQLIQSLRRFLHQELN
jgi:hypothetical protein